MACAPRRCLALLVCAFAALAALFTVSAARAGSTAYASLPGGEFASALQYEDSGSRVRAEDRYLSHWAGTLDLGAHAQPQQPVVWVSWFAASAYCKAQGAHLPSWSQWELAAAADDTRADARDDPAWRERILAWYAQPSRQALAAVGAQRPNVYGVRDLHGLVWEWTDDFSALLVSADNRNQGDPDRLKFCGAGALAINDRDNYAVLMRVAMLSSLEAADATANLGFRCAR
jgi:formylglycine-generating enzyme